MKVINARLRKKEGLYTVTCDNDVIKSIELQTGISVDSDTDTIDAKENLLMAPFIDPHIHLDAVLTAGEPEWNMTGTFV